MRIKIGIIILLVVGIILMANLFIDNRTTSTLQLANVSGCSECHSGGKPTYDTAFKVHGKHVDLDCSQCHIQLTNVTGCSKCHSSGVPTYDTVFRVHGKHAALNCSRCHGDRDGVKRADSFHNILEWFGMGTMLFALIGIITNLFIINRRGKVN